MKKLQSHRTIATEDLFFSWTLGFDKGLIVGQVHNQSLNLLRIQMKSTFAVAYPNIQFHYIKVTHVL